MSTVIRAELSHKSKYHIDKHRYYELKHFCLQYPNWKKSYAEVDAMAQNGGHERISPTNRVSDMTAACAEKKLYYLKRMELVHECAKLADPDLSEYIVKAVTSNLGYAYLKTKLDIREGTASSQETTHFLKLGTTKARMEKEALSKQIELLQAKTESLKSQAHVEELYKEALDAMRRYSGQDCDDA